MALLAVSHQSAKALIIKMGIYLDNAATSYPKPECVVNSMSAYLDNIGANAGRASHRRAHEASRLVYETREAVAAFIGAKDSSRVIFTQNATESLNLAILGLNLNTADHILTSSIEHNSVMRPLKYLEKEKGVVIDIIQCDKDGRLNLNNYESRITRNTKLIVINHASNVVGTILPIREIGKIAGKHNIPFLVDAAQTIGCLPLDIEKDIIDMLAFSGHKGLLGPQGIGCLYMKKCIELQPLKFGGTGSNSESTVQPTFLPDKFESGTLNLPGIAGLKASIKYIESISVIEIQRKIINLTNTLIDNLYDKEKINIYGVKVPDQRTGVVLIDITGKTPSFVGRVLDEKYDIGVRVGLHCSPQCHRTIGTFPDGGVRVSIGWFNTEKDIEILCGALCQIAG